jgi:hypothetical protein
MNQLNYPETLIAYSSIDTTAASVAMAFSDKNVLAARKVLIIGTGLQGIAFCIQGIVISQLTRFDPTCFSQVPHPFFSSSTIIMWILWTIRVFAAFSSVPTIYRLSKRLHEVEHAPRDGLQVKEARTWFSLPSTLFSNHLLFLSLIVSQGVPTILIVSGSLSRSWTMLWTEWGQSAALIIAMAVIGHVLYSFTRLFRMEAVEHRIKICEANKTSIDWGEHYQSQLSQLSWSNIVLRSPFGKINLTITDGLFIDDSALESNTKIQITMTEEERDALWDEMLGAFRLNDKVGVKDCFARGVSMDRTDQYEEYPTHMARLGDVSILKQTHLPSAVNRLLSKNKVGDTPLQIAFNANKLETTQWICGEYVKHLDDRILGHVARKAIRDLANNAIDAEREDTLKIITDVLPEWWNEMTQDALSQRHSFLVTALMQDKIASAVFLSKRLTHDFEPSSYDLVAFYGTDMFQYSKPDFAMNLYRRLIRHTPDILDTKPSLHLGQYSRSFSLAHILRRALLGPQNELITDLLSSKLNLPLHFIDSVYMLPAFPFTDGAKADLMQRGALDWNDFWNDLKLRDLESIKSWMEITAKAGNCVRMLQTSNSRRPLAVEYVLNWKAYKRYRQPAMHVLQLMKDYGASVHDQYYMIDGTWGRGAWDRGRWIELDHPFVLVSCCPKPVKRMVLDMALAQEKRESLPGWSIWAICDIIYFTADRSARENRLVEDGIWYLHCLELLLLETGPQAYKKHRTVWDDKTPFQYLSGKQKEIEIVKKHDWAPNHWVLEEAVQLLSPWEDVHMGKRPTPPSIPEHSKWKSFGEWEDIWTKQDADTDLEDSYSDEEQLLLSQYSDFDYSGPNHGFGATRPLRRREKERSEFRAQMNNEQMRKERTKGRMKPFRAPIRKERG